MNNIHNKLLMGNYRVILAAIVSFLFIAIFHDFCFFKENLTVKFEYESSKDIEFEVFYCLDNRDNFSAKWTAKKNVNKGRGTVEIQIPAKQIQKFRLDIGRVPGRVNIDNLCLIGAERINLDMGSFRPIGIDTFSSNGSRLNILSKSKDPYIVYTKPINLQCKINPIDYYNLFVVGVASFYFTYVLLDLFDRKKTTRAKSNVPSLQNLEFLRVFFTFAVLATHFFPPFKIWCSGGQAVQFFFLLSGYLLALTYKPERSILDVAVSRWIRFVPLVVFGGLLSGGGWASFQGCWMLQNTGLILSNVPNAPAWYIGVLFWCTIFYMALLKSYGKRNILIVIAIIGFLTLLFTIHTPGDRKELFAGFMPRGMLRGLSCVAIGIVLSHFCQRKKFEVIKKPQRIVYTIGEFFILYYIIVGCFDKQLYVPYWSVQILSHVVLLYLFVMKRGYLSAFFEKKVFVVLAKYSLSVYLTHWVFVTTVSTYVIKQYPGWMKTHDVLSITIAIVGSCLLGVLAHHLIEKPCTRYLSRFYAWMKGGCVN